MYTWVATDENAATCSARAFVAATAVTSIELRVGRTTVVTVRADRGTVLAELPPDLVGHPLAGDEHGHRVEVGRAVGDRLAPHARVVAEARRRV